MERLSLRRTRSERSVPRRRRCLLCWIPPVTRFSDDPQLGPTQERTVRDALMGDIMRPGSVPMRLTAEVIGTAPIERIDVLHGARVVQAVQPYEASDLGRRVRVLWQGAEYRGRGRETNWQGRLKLSGNRIARFEPVNFLNPERKVQETTPGTALEWNSVTTGNMAGIDLCLDDAWRGALTIDSNIVSGKLELARLKGEKIIFDAGGLGRQLSVYRLPEADWSRRVVLDHQVTFPGRIRAAPTAQQMYGLDRWSASHVRFRNPSGR